MRLFVACAFLGLGLTLATGGARAADDDVCTTMTGFADQLGKGNGKMIDKITKQESVTADCAAKVFAVKWSITVPAAAMKPDWVGLVGGNIEKAFCRDMDFMRAMEAGWKVTLGWMLADGKTAQAEVDCSD